MPFAAIISFFAGPASTVNGERDIVKDAFRLWTASAQTSAVEENTNITETDFESETTTTPLATVSSILFLAKAHTTTITGSQAPALAHTFPLKEVEQFESESTSTIPVFKSIMDPTLVSNNRIGPRPTTVVSYKLSKLDKVVCFELTKPCPRYS